MFGSIYYFYLQDNVLYQVVVKIKMFQLWSAAKETGWNDHQAVIGQVQLSQEIKCVLEGVGDPGEPVAGQDQGGEATPQAAQ